MARRKHKIGDMVRLDPYHTPDEAPIGIIFAYNGPYYVVKWFGSKQQDGGYVWTSLKKI